MDLFTFNPPNRNITIDGGPYELGPFSIKVMSLIHRRFGSVQNFQNVINGKREENGIYKKDFPTYIMWTAYTLLTEKDYFESQCQFGNRFVRQKQAVYEQNIDAIIETISDSQPVINFKDLSGRNDGPVDDSAIDLFSRSYATIARDTGYTVEQFYNLTLRQINQIQDDLSFIKNQEREFQAGIHGAKIQKPPDNRPNAVINFTPEEDRTIVKYRAKRMAEVIRERSELYN